MRVLDPEKFNNKLKTEGNYRLNGKVKIPSVIKSGNDDKMRNIINSICSYDLEDENAICSQRAGLYQFMSKIHQHSRKKSRLKTGSGNYDEIISKANSFIESNFTNSSISLADIPSLFVDRL